MEENKPDIKESKNKFLTPPKFLKNHIFIFTICVLIFLLSFYLLIVMDDNNDLRQYIPFFNCPQIQTFFGYFGIKPFHVGMTTWFLFFFIFGAFFIWYFVFLFRKPNLKAKQIKVLQKTGREMTVSECKRFNLIYWVVAALVFILLCVAIFVVFKLTGYWDKLNWNPGPGVENPVVNLFKCLGIILCFILIVPAIFIVLILVFKIIIWLLSIIVGGISNSVMQSEGYQFHKATSQAVADDITRKMLEAEGYAKDSMKKVKESKGEVTRAMAPQADVLFPALTSIDKSWEIKEAEKAEILKKGKETPNEEKKPLDYDQFRLLAYEFQSYLCHQKYYFDINIIRSFIAGMAAARLILLEGLSGTGKSTLPRVFLEYIGGKAYFFPVQATWRDRSDITGYYSDFTGEFKETELLKHLYEARYIPETVNLMVLDEMNISRVEYYFADFLSIFEYPSEDWLVPLLQVKPDTTLPKYIEKGMVRIPTNTWFVGTVNIDDSTFTITDKVYDRAIVIDFKELNLPFETSYSFEPHPISMDELEAMFEICKNKPENNLTENERKKFLKLTQFVSDTFDIQFGNRIMNQIDCFLPVFVGLGGSKNEALDIMFARKILRKVDGKFESYIRDGLNKLSRYINAEYGKRTFKETETLIEVFRKKLS